MQHIARPQRPSSMPPKFPEQKGALTSEILRHIDAARDRKICASLHRAYFDRFARAHGDSLPLRNVSVALRARDRNYRIAIEAQRRAADRDLESSGRLGIAHQTVRRSKR